MLGVYSLIDGIGEKLAQNIYEAYPSLKEFIKAYTDDEIKIKGIGKERLEAIKRFAEGDQK